jgi:hypothetical protein
MSRGSYLRRTSGGTQTKRNTGRGTSTSFGPAGSGSAGSGRSETERLQSQLAGAQALQRRTMAQLGAGDINKQQSKDAMRRANDRIRQSAQGLASINPSNTIKGNIQFGDGSRPMNSAGRAKFDQIMRGVTGGVGSNFDNMSRGLLLSGQNIGGRNFPQGFSPYQGKDMRMGLNKFAPISQKFQDLARRGIGPFNVFKGRLNERADARIVDSSRGIADMLSPDYNEMSEEYAQTLRNTPEGADEIVKQILSPQDMGITAQPGRFAQSPQDMGITNNLLDRRAIASRNIPDGEDADKAVDLAGRAIPTPNAISDRQSPLDSAPMTLQDVANQERLNAIRSQIALNSGILANLPEGIDPTRIGSVQGAGQGLQNVFDMQNFVDNNPMSIYPQGYPTQKVGNFDTGLNFYGGNVAFGNTPEARAALETLRSNNPNQTFTHMLGGTALRRADGGIASLYGQ